MGVATDVGVSHSAHRPIAAVSIGLVEPTLVMRTPTQSTMRVLFSAALSACLAHGLNAQVSTEAPPAAASIISSGAGEMRIKPDRAKVTLIVLTKAGSSATAGRSNAEHLSTLLAALSRLGFADSAVATSGYSVDVEQPAYGVAPPPRGTPSTYVARNAIRVSVGALEGLGRLVDSALVFGASAIDNVTFESSQAPQARARAIALAVRSARADAEAAASAAGGILGRLVHLRLSPDPAAGYAGLQMRVAGIAGGRATPMMPGDISITVSAELQYEFIVKP